MMEALRERWRAEVFTSHPWKFDRHREVACGMLDGVWLERHPTEAPYGAYLKPTSRCRYPAAAREKIAADLAYDLGVPSVPVLLSDKGKAFGSPQDECCVSLVTHPRTPPWSQVFNAAVRTSPAGEKMCRSAPDRLSRIAVFDLWIANPDRDNGGNIVYADDPQDPARSGFCALDHSAAMGGSRNSWANGGWRQIVMPPFPESMRPLLDKEVMLRAVQQIVAYPDDRIRDCITRIPEAYLDGASRNDTVNGLIGRKPDLPAFVLQYLEEG